MLLFAIPYGFEPTKTPGNGILYDFQHQLLFGRELVNDHKVFERFRIP